MNDMVPVPMGLVQLSLDLVGVFVFALTGALLAVRKQLDIVGILILAFVTGLGGGMLRDVLIAAVPPPGLTDWRYLVTTAFAALLTFRFHPRIGRIERYVNWLDAFGLGLFCVTGSLKAMHYGLSPVAGALLGMVTAIGGGVMRDLLAGRTPVVLREDVYAVPALVGSTIIVTTWTLGIYRSWVAVVAVVVCIVLRGLAIHFRWQVPRAGAPD